MLWKIMPEIFEHLARVMFKNKNRNLLFGGYCNMRILSEKKCNIYGTHMPLPMCECGLIVFCKKET